MNAWIDKKLQGGVGVWGYSVTYRYISKQIENAGGKGEGGGGGVDLSNIMTSKKIYMVKVLFNFRKKLGEG